jgi:hypothetical protein
MSEKQLVKKLTEVMKQVGYIQKTGFNKFHKYNYATEADVNEKVRKELAERNVMMIPNVKSCTYREHANRSGNVEYITTVEVEFTFMDGDTGETIVFSSFGEGQDAGDKGVYKAITGAQKYALMKAFMIPTGDDPEADTGADERNSKAADKPKQQEQKKDDDLSAIERNSKLNNVLVKWQTLSGEKDSKKSREAFAEFLDKQQYSIESVPMNVLVSLEEKFAKKLLDKAKSKKESA